MVALHLHPHISFLGFPVVLYLYWGTYIIELIVLYTLSQVRKQQQPP